MGIRVYVSRDGIPGSSVEMYNKKPVWHEATDVASGYWDSRDSNVYGILLEMCYTQFKRVTGFTIKRGECKRVRIEIKEV